ncbi:hypothetical protein L1987_14359 [Smallanthus sonchifolius]|uniref:Uncharacterized protein n=1 Tax=Smallanthus sonchifolius TaxID=185202 RepID=A0ACB9J555_9ASTR|nr:hypothetical protein L1987_14359 [Smallanthus sonchifolius]
MGTSFASRITGKGVHVKAGNGFSPESLSAFSALLLGAISKSIAIVLTYPAIRCTVLIQAADSSDDETKENKRKSLKTLSSVLGATWKQEGIFGFLRDCSTHECGFK